MVIPKPTVREWGYYNRSYFSCPCLPSFPSPPSLAQPVREKQVLAVASGPTLPQPVSSHSLTFLPLALFSSLEAFPDLSRDTTEGLCVYGGGGGGGGVGCWNIALRLSVLVPSSFWGGVSAVVHIHRELEGIADQVSSTLNSLPVTLAKSNGLCQLHKRLPGCMSPNAHISTWQHTLPVLFRS